MKRTIERRYKQRVEERYSENNRDLDAVLSSRITFSAYDKYRKALCFETHGDAVQRSNSERKKRRVAWEHLQFDEEGLLRKVRSLSKVL